MDCNGARASLPCRYVSGYLFIGVEDQDRSAEDATHAWVEALLPGLGWVGFRSDKQLIATNVIFVWQSGVITPTFRRRAASSK